MLPVIGSVFASFPASVLIHMRSTPMLDLLSPLLLHLDQLRSTPDLSPFIPAIDDAIGASLAYHSIPSTLRFLPLNLPHSPLPPSDFTAALTSSRQWLLVLARTHGRGHPLQGYWDCMWPEVQALREARSRWDEASDTTRAKACALLEEQVWDTFPAFCSWASDLSAAKGWARKTGEWLADEAHPYPHTLICRGLHLLITQNQEVVLTHAALQAQQAEDEDAAEAQRVFDEEDDDDEDGAPRAPPPPKAKPTKAAATARYPFDPSAVDDDTARGNLATLASYAKNFLPLLFNLVSRQEHQRDVVLACVEVYAGIADGPTINSLFKRALKRMLEANAAAAESAAGEGDREKAHSLADIVLAMTAALDEENLGLLYRSLTPQLSSSDAIAQKKAYKLLAAVCRHHADFFARHWQDMLTAVTVATAALLPSAAKVRLACLTALCLPIPLLLAEGGQDPRGLLGSLPALLGEVLLALKEPSFKTRHAAYQFINEMGAAMRAGDAALQRGGGDVSEWGLTSPASPHPLFHEYTYMLMGGLAGTSPHMQSATVMAFSHLLFSARGAGPGVITPQLLGTFLPLMGSKAREVQKSMMGLCKVMALCLQADELRGYAQAIIDGLGRWGEGGGRARFQEKVRAILDILMRKIGVDEVRAMVGRDQLKLVEHIRKMKAREAKAKAEAWAKRKAARGEEVKEEAGTMRKTDFEGALYGSDEEGEEEEEEKAQPQRARRKERSREAGLSVREGTEDLLGSDMVLNVAKAKAAPVEGEDESHRKKKKKREVRENAEGKLLVMEDDGGDDEPASSEEEGEGGGGEGRVGGKGKKRGREGGEERGEGSKRRMVGTAGAAYAGKGGAGGDAKRRGQKFDPYAFIPLDASVLNKRKQSSTRKKMETMIGRTQKDREQGGKGKAGGGQAGGGRPFSHSKQQKKHKS